MDIDEVHLTPGLDPGGDAQTALITGSGVSVGKLKPVEDAQEWLLRPMPPFDFEAVVVKEQERHEAVEAAIRWLESYFRGEGAAAAEAAWGDSA